MERTYVFDSPKSGNKKQTEKNNRSEPKKKKASAQSKSIQQTGKQSAPVKKNAASKKSAAPQSKQGVKRGSAVRRPDEVKRTKVRIRTVKSTEKKKFPLAIVFSAVACTIIFMVMIWSFVQINEETIRIEALERELKTAVAEEKELKLRLEEKNNLKKIEEYAKTQLGMVQIDQLAKKYISVSSEDKIELADGKGESDTEFFNGIGEKFRWLFEYFGKP